MEQTQERRELVRAMNVANTLCKELDERLERAEAASERASSKYGAVPVEYSEIEMAILEELREARKVWSAIRKQVYPQG